MYPGQLKWPWPLCPERDWYETRSVPPPHDGHLGRQPYILQSAMREMRSYLLPLRSWLLNLRRGPEEGYVRMRGAAQPRNSRHRLPTHASISLSCATVFDARSDSMLANTQHSTAQQVQSYIKHVTRVGDHGVGHRRRAKYNARHDLLLVVGQLRCCGHLRFDKPLNKVSLTPCETDNMAHVQAIKTHVNTRRRCMRATGRLQHLFSAGPSPPAGSSGKPPGRRFSGCNRGSVSPT